MIYISLISLFVTTILVTKYCRKKQNISIIVEKINKN